MSIDISIKEEKTRFDNFLKEDGNTNIIFSGKFGVGKTYFINEFFNDPDCGFQRLYISPVNYSIANNEDIFEYIKVNILFQLLEKNYCALENKKPNLSARLLSYVKNNGKEIIQDLLEKSASIGILNLDDEFSTAIKSLFLLSSFWPKTEGTDNNTQSDNENIEDFIKNLSTKKGSIYENDVITQLIKQIISFIKEDTHKPIVLVIDDLDRIDPEHIFRILNILSAHENFCESGLNKFGIDKTILVCDINNIRNIYKAKYGIDVDFNGYIDKFYSKEIYHFDNTDNVIKAVSVILCSMKSKYENSLIIPNEFTSKSCQALLKALLRANKLNLRTLLKINEKNYDNTRTIKLSWKTVLVNDFISLPVFDFLKTMLGSIEELEEAILNLTASNIKSFEKDICIGFIALADYENNGFEPKEFNYTENVMYTLDNPYYPDIIKDTHNFWVDYKDKLDALEIVKKAFTNYKNHFLK